MMCRPPSLASAFVVLVVVFAALPPAMAQRADLVAMQKRVEGLYVADNFAAALVEAQKLEQVVRARFGTNHPNYAVALNNLGIVTWKQAKYGEAEGLYRRALAIKEGVLGPDHPEVGRDLNNLALVYRDQGKYGEAEPLYRRA